MAAITGSAVRRHREPEILQEKIVQQARMERAKKAQDERSWIADLKTYRSGDIAKLNLEEAKTSSLIAPDYEVDEYVLLFYSLRSATKAEDRANELDWWYLSCCSRTSYTITTLA